MKLTPGSGRIIVIVPEAKRKEEDVIASVARRVRAVSGAELIHVASFAETSLVVRDAVRAGVERVIAVGGDGALHALVNAFRALKTGTKTVLGVIPAGTGNDFAGSAGIPRDDTSAALDIAFEAEPVPIDIGRVNDRYFLNLMSGGYGSRVTTELPGELKNLLGSFAYLLSGVRRIRDLQPRFGRLKAPEFMWEGRMYGFSICNGRTAGGGIVISHDALINDGLFDLVIFPDMSPADFGAMLKSLLLKPALAEDSGVIVQRVGSLELDIDADWRVSLDGEPYTAERYSVQLLSKRLFFCLPERSPLLNSSACSKETPRTRSLTGKNH